MLSGLFGSDAPSINRKEMKKFREGTLDAARGNEQLTADFQQFMQGMEQYTNNLMQTVIPMQMDAFNQQMAQSQEMFDYAKQDREYYNSVYRPMREQFAQKASGYDTVERREGAAARAKGDVASAFRNAKLNEQARLEGFGIDPSEARGGALDKDLAIEQAKAQAQAGTMAANRVEDVGLQLQDQAIRQGDPLLNRDIQQAQLGSQLAGTGTNMGAGALQGANSTYGLQGGNYGMASNMYGQTANMYNSAANQMLGVHNARLGSHAGSVDPAQAIWGLGSGVAGAWAGSDSGSAAITNFFGSEGGVVPDPANPAPPGPPAQDPRQTDTVRAGLTPGEFVIPEEAVRWKGEEYFHKQVAKAQEDSAKAKGAPAGAIPAPQQQQQVA